MFVWTGTDCKRTEQPRSDIREGSRHCATTSLAVTHLINTISQRGSASVLLPLTRTGKQYCVSLLRAHQSLLFRPVICFRFDTVSLNL